MTKPVLQEGGNLKIQALWATAECAAVFFKRLMQFSNFKNRWISSESMFVAPNRKGKLLPMLADRLECQLCIDLEKGDSLFIKSLLTVHAIKKSN